MRLFSFSLLIGGGALLGHLYLYRRLLRHLAPGRRARAAVLVVLATMTALLLARRWVRDLGPDVAGVYSRLAYGWIALALCTLVVVALADVVRLLRAFGTRLRTRRREPEAKAHDEDRRRFLAQAAHWSAAAAGISTTTYGAWRAFTPPEVTELSIPLARLPKSLDGFTIVQLSDVHVGPYIGRNFVDELVRRTNALRPDLVVITGDLVDAGVDTIGDAVGGFGGLRARHGTCFVTGNHEYHSDDVAWCRFLERLGFTVLRNRRVEIGDAGGRFDLIGVDDYRRPRPGEQRYDLDAALAGRNRDRAAVLLAHKPENFRTAAARGVDLQLSGHTHGGQVFPMTSLINLRWEYVRGLYAHDASHIYVSRGCGFWGPPVRVGSPPEIVRIALTSSA